MHDAASGVPRTVGVDARALAVPGAATALGIAQAGLDPPSVVFKAQAVRIVRKAHAEPLAQSIEIVIESVGENSKRETVRLAERQQRLRTRVELDGFQKVIGRRLRQREPVENLEVVLPGSDLAACETGELRGSPLASVA